MSARIIIDERVVSNLGMASRLVSRAVEKLKALPLDEDTLFGLKLCFHEALVNAVKHGNKENVGLAVHGIIKVKDRKWVIEVMDQGRGFDFSAIPNPATEENIGKHHGRGIFLMQSIMDSMEFLDGGRAVRLSKRFP